MGYHWWTDLLVASSFLFWCLMIQYSSSVACHSIGQASPSMWQGGALYFSTLQCPSKFCRHLTRSLLPAPLRQACIEPIHAPGILPGISMSKTEMVFYRVSLLSFIQTPSLSQASHRRGWK